MWEEVVRDNNYLVALPGFGTSTSPARLGALAPPTPLGRHRARLFAADLGLSGVAPGTEQRPHLGRQTLGQAASPSPHGLAASAGHRALCPDRPLGPDRALVVVATLHFRAVALAGAHKVLGVVTAAI